MEATAIFTEIYERRLWGGVQSASGTGSDIAATRVLRAKLPELLHQLSVTSVLDIPCGDYLWMSQVDLSGISYIGGDIVRELICENQRRYLRDGARFQRLDLLADDLPRADLVLCRDCLVHFSFHDIHRALANILRTNASYLMTTTFRDRHGNCDILTGQWRPLNLEAPPFNWPTPAAVIVEECDEERGRYADKILALWPLTTLRGRN